MIPFVMKRRGLVAALALMLAMASMFAISAALPAFAQASTVYTATATPYYRHPGTGVIEDSGGEDSEVLGQSMTEGATQPYGFLEIDDAGNKYVSIRLGLMDNIQNVNIMADDNWTGSYYTCNYEVPQTDDANHTADFRMLVNDEGAVFRVNMYVVPMGREVIFYIALSNFVEGNTQGFYQSADSGSSSSEATATTTETTETAQQSETATASVSKDALQAKVDETNAALESGEDKDEAAKGTLQQVLASANNVLANESATQEEVDSALASLTTALDEYQASTASTSSSDSSDTGGMQVFDEEGNEVQTSTDSSEGSGLPMSTLILIIVLVVVIAAALIWFFAFYRPKHSASSGAAAAAAAAAPPVLEDVPPSIADKAANDDGSSDDPQADAADGAGEATDLDKTAIADAQPTEKIAQDAAAVGADADGAVSDAVSDADGATKKIDLPDGES